MILIKLKHFLWMGGYWQFLWPAYGITMLTLMSLCWHAKRSHRKMKHVVREMGIHASDS